MLCSDHRKLVEGPCLLCGVPLCQKCITKQEGRKLFCRFCSEKTDAMPKRVRPLPAKENKAEEKVTKILQTSKSGYFDFSLIRKL